MARQHSRTADLPPVRQGSSDRRGSSLRVVQHTTAIDSGSCARERVPANPLPGDCDDPGILRSSDPLWDQLHAIRRRLWIVSTSLESLPAKIELAYRSRSRVAHGARPDEPGLALSASSDESPVTRPEGSNGGWWARRKCARLRSRASRAERRAAAAIHDASVSFGTALEAVLQAAVARAQADEAWLTPRRAPCFRSGDCGSNRDPVSPCEGTSDR
jgi:hypothetical protein